MYVSAFVRAKGVQRVVFISREQKTAWQAYAVVDQKSTFLVRTQRVSLKKEQALGNVGNTAVF